MCADYSLESLKLLLKVASRGLARSAGEHMSTVLQIILLVWRQSIDSYTTIAQRLPQSFSRTIWHDYICGFNTFTFISPFVGIFVVSNWWFVRCHHNTGN